MSNEQIVQEIQAGTNVSENLGLLYQQNIRYIRKIAKTFAKNEMDLEDLMQECYFAIAKAADSYDMEGGASFLTYATYWIWSCCGRYAYKISNGHMSTTTLRKISSYRKILRDYSQEHGELPTDDYIMKQLQMNKKQYNGFLRNIAGWYVCSIEEQVGSDDDGLNIGDTIPSKEDIEEEYIQEDLNRMLWEQVEKLDDPRQCLVINRLYKENKTQLQIAEELCVSVARVQQIERKTLHILEKMDEVQEAAQYYGYTGHNAYGYTFTRFKQTGSSSVEFLALKHVEQAEEMKKLDAVFDEIMQMA